MVITDTQLSEIKARTRYATPGPWEYLGARAIGGCAIVPMGGPAVVPDAWGTNYYDADFIAHARSDVPALVAEVERLRAECDKARRGAEAAALRVMELEGERDRAKVAALREAADSMDAAADCYEQKGHSPDYMVIRRHCAGLLRIRAGEIEDERTNS